MLPTTSGRPDLPNTLGAGGGTIAAYNRHFNAVQIRPESAGSDRGPACYDRGGLRPTVTDADPVLGYLDPDNYADGPRLTADQVRQVRSLRDGGESIAELVGGFVVPRATIYRALGDTGDGEPAAGAR